MCTARGERRPQCLQKEEPKGWTDGSSLVQRSRCRASLGLVPSRPILQRAPRAQWALLRHPLLAEGPCPLQALRERGHERRGRLTTQEKAQPGLIPPQGSSPEVGAGPAWLSQSPRFQAVVHWEWKATSVHISPSWSFQDTVSLWSP